MEFFLITLIGFLFAVLISTVIESPDDNVGNLFFYLLGLLLMLTLSVVVVKKQGVEDGRIRYTPQGKQEKAIITLDSNDIYQVSWTNRW